MEKLHNRIAGIVKDFHLPNPDKAGSRGIYLKWNGSLLFADE